MSSAVPISMVLGNDGLLGDILLRVDSPTTLARAALVSKRWYQGASFPAFLRRFRELNPPRLLGVYVNGNGIPYPEFIQVPTSQPPEHTAVARRANFGFADFVEFSSTVWDCRNGRVLYDYELDQPFHLGRAPAVRTPLRYPGQDLAMFLPPPINMQVLPLAMLLPDDVGDNATCYRIDISMRDRVFYAKVSVLRSGKWSIHCSAMERLAKNPEKILATTLFADGKIYMMATAGFILGLDMSTATFFIIELPEGVTFEYDGGLVLCRGDNSALYLFHVKGDKLSVWLRRADDHADEWVLKDTISVKETCADFIDKGPEQSDGVAPAEVGPEPPADGGDDALIEVVPEPPADDGDNDALIEVGPEAPADDGGDAPIDVVGVGDNAEFVFLELGDSGIIVYLHLGSKKVEKVYQRDLDNDSAITIHPFLMVWPPVFPALQEAD